MLSYLTANSHAEADDENGDSELMKDSKGAEDVPEQLLQKEGLDQDGQDAEHVQDVQDGDGDDHGRNERLELMPFPKREDLRIRRSFSSMIQSAVNLKQLPKSTQS